MVKEERVIRGIPAWLMGEYLKELGGSDEGDGRYAAVGWSAHVEQIEDFQLSSLRVGQIRFILQGEKTAVDALKPRLETKLLRGGG